MRKRETAFRHFYLGIRSLVVALLLFVVSIPGTLSEDQLTRLQRFDSRVEQPKDYLPQQTNFILNGDISSAIALGNFAKENPDIPHAREIIALANREEATFNSWWSRTKRTASGFLTGDTSSAEGIGGDMVANFLVYGNIRDLAKEGYHKATGQPVDELLVALSAVGLAADVMTYFPPTTEGGAPAEVGIDLLKALKRAGALTAEFSGKLLKLATGARTAEHLKALGQACLDTFRLYKRLPAGMIGYVMHSVNSADELANVAKEVEWAPIEVALISKIGDTEGIAEVKAVSSKEKLIRYLKFGGQAANELRKPTSLIIGMAKTLHIKKIREWLWNLFPRIPRLACAWVIAAVGLLVLLNAARHFIFTFAPTCLRAVRGVENAANSETQMDSIV